MKFKHFDFQIPTRILFGLDSLQSIGAAAVPLGKKGMLVSGRHTMRSLGVLDRVIKSLNKEGIQTFVFDQIDPDPCSDIVNRGGELCREEEIEFIIGLGGGSAIDAAKAIAVLAVNKGADAWDFTTNGSKGSKAVGHNTLPIVAIPTTAGTGTEVTRGAVLRHQGEKIKDSIGSDFIAPVLAVIDPLLSVSMPAALTATTGLDALTQCVESFSSARANPLSNTFALRGIELIGTHLRQAVVKPEDLNARSAMALGAMFSGIALSQAGVGAAHAISMVLGGRYCVEHGIGVSMFLEGTSKHNAVVAPDKYAQIAKALSVDVRGCSIEDAAILSVSAMQSLIQDVGLDMSLKELGVPEEELREIAQAAVQHPDMGPNPAKLSIAEVHQLLKEAY